MEERVGIVGSAKGPEFFIYIPEQLLNPIQVVLMTCPEMGNPVSNLADFKKPGIPDLLWRKVWLEQLPIARNSFVEIT